MKISEVLPTILALIAAITPITAAGIPVISEFGLTYDDDLANIAIDPHEFFTSFRFDPRLGYEEFKKHKNRLVGEYGFRKEQISLSTLNQSNRLKFVLS